MASFTKYLTKSYGTKAFALAINLPHENLINAADTFTSTFVIDHVNDRIPHKSLVYREDFNTLAHLPPINLILCRVEDLDQLSRISFIISNSHPDFAVFTNEYIIGMKRTDQFKEYRYQIKEKRKQFEIWEFKGKRKK